MDKDTQFERFWEWLGGLGFRQQEKIGLLFKEIYTLEKTSNNVEEKGQLKLVRDWLLVPYSFWPVDFKGIGNYLCHQIKSGRKPDARFGIVCEFLRKFPAQIAQNIVIDHELSVRQGEYGQFIRANAKFDAFERDTLNNPVLMAEWEQLNREHDVAKFLDTKGIVRRTMICERNFKPEGWEFKGFASDEDAFQLAFDAFCYKWHLYGMEKGRPLLLKLTVNVCPHGVLIMIPSYWNPDFKRDINWGAIARLIKANGTMRQGTKLALNQSERREQARRTYEASQTAEEQQLLGEERREYIVRQARLNPGTDEREIRRLSAQYKKVLAGASISTSRRRWRKPERIGKIVLPEAKQSGDKKAKEPGA